jgi:asparagine synthase (glutamine-hydrolysing)
MCGISGIINKNGNKVCKHRIKTMNDKIIHRGPDSEGFYFDKNIGFGHRRLSILDLSSLGHQPMNYLDRYVITYNGEIYNYIEIKNELLSLGYTFVSGTDTEVILASYDCWKEKSLLKFNGMWAFAIYDKLEQTVFLARDRFGVKPLYYTDNNDEFLFSSEIKQLLSDHNNELNIDTLVESMLTHIDNHTDETYFKGIKSFPSSHFMYYCLKNNIITKERYYKLEINEVYKNKSMLDLINDFRNIFINSINIRLRSDVKVGSCLSGGLDSSSITYLASEEYVKSSTKKFTSINAKSIDSSNDESEFAKTVADISNVDLHYVTPDYNDFLKTIDEVIYTQEEPFGSPSMFMGWHVFQKAKELKCSVMLNGQGGDEILLGYERYFSSTMSLKNPFLFLKQALNQFKNSRLSFKDTFLYFLYFTNKSIRIYFLKKKSFLKKIYKSNHQFSFIKKSVESFSNPDKLQIFEISVLQLPHLLRYEDRNSMRHSIETRLPFLDYRLVEFAISLPTTLKIKDGWTKFILRKAIEDLLPPNIVWRKNKFGFEAPDKIWLNNYAIEMYNEVKSSKILNRLCDMKSLEKKYNQLSLKDRWMYFNIARWEKIYNVVISKN